MKFLAYPHRRFPLEPPPQSLSPPPFPGSGERTGGGDARPKMAAEVLESEGDKKYLIHYCGGWFGRS